MIIVLDFGGQYTHLIARRIRELGVYSEILPFNVPIKKLKALSSKGIILSGGPSSVYDKDAPICLKEILDLGIPVLGICYGQQLIAHLANGSVKHNKQKQYGRAQLSLDLRSPIFQGLSGKEPVWFSHGDQVIKLPSGYRVIAKTSSCKVAALENSQKKIYGLQFHPEVVHTPGGRQILSNFLFEICKTRANWKIPDLKERLIKDIQKEVQDSSVLIAVSGGVDSMVAATLMHEAIGDKLHCVFVDTGLMRKNEPEEIENVFKKLHFKIFYHVKAEKEFLNKLKGILDPEEKRKVIGHLFIKTFEQKAKKLSTKSDIKYLAQGTIYPDRIESAGSSKNAAKIKSHHNLTLPEKLHLKIIEPLKDLYKDEVRKLGDELGVKKEILWRHPFPGPGLAIRVLGELTPERLAILRECDWLFMEYLKKSGLYDKIWQAFAALIPVKAVGVKGDARAYEYIIALRAVDSVDGMTADWYKIPQHNLEEVSNLLLNKTRGVSRVLYDVSQKPPATIEYE